MASQKSGKTQVSVGHHKDKTKAREQAKGG